MNAYANAGANVYPADVEWTLAVAAEPRHDAPTRASQAPARDCAERQSEIGNLPSGARAWLRATSSTRPRRADRPRDEAV